jgi:Uncharacterized protein conserved in bacteria
MRPEWRAHLDELMEQYQTKRAELKDLQEHLGALEATVITEDEMITVTVGPQGRLTALEFNPRVYRSLSPPELAAAIVAATQQAAAEVGGKMRAAMGSLAPAGEFDLSKVLTERPDDFEQLKEQYGFRDR